MFSFQKGVLFFCFCLCIHAKIDEDNRYVRVAIVGTNDIHGSALPTSLFRADTNQTYNYGGLQFMASMIQTIREENKGNFLYLDAGDQFQGGIQSSSLVSSGEIMNDYFNSMDLDGSAIGNHQFDFGPSFLFSYWAQRQKNSWNIAANLRSEKGEEQFLPNQKNSWIYELQSGIKIGVVGLITLQTPKSTRGFVQNLFPSYEFSSYAKAVEREGKLLREKGAHVVILVSHMGNDCSSDNTYGWWYESSIQVNTCSKTDEMSKLLASLPTGTLDAVVQGHRHTFSHHFINGVPVMGVINGGYYFNVLYLHFFDQKLVEAVIEGPVPVCQKVFQFTRKCNYHQNDLLKKAGSLVQWSFHGRQVVAHPQVSRLFEKKWLPKMSKFLQPLALNQLVLQRYLNGESLLGNLITNLMDMAFPGHDFILINELGFRTTWFPGIIQYQHFYSMFPFPNRLLSFQMTGYELIQSIKLVQQGRTGFFATKNLKQYIRIHKNGSREVTRVTFSNGTQIDLGRSYRGVSIDFLLKGGDGFRDIIGRIYELRKQVWLGEFRQSLRPQLIKMGLITRSRLLDPNNPRLILDIL